MIQAHATSRLRSQGSHAAAQDNSSSRIELTMSPRFLVMHLSAGSSSAGCRNTTNDQLRFVHRVHIVKTTPHLLEEFLLRPLGQAELFVGVTCLRSFESLLHFGWNLLAGQNVVGYVSIVAVQDVRRSVEETSWIGRLSAVSALQSGETVTVCKKGSVGRG